MLHLLFTHQVLCDISLLAPGSLAPRRGDRAWSRGARAPREHRSAVAPPPPTDLEAMKGRWEASERTMRPHRHVWRMSQGTFGVEGQLAQEAAWWNRIWNLLSEASQGVRSLMFTARHVHTSIYSGHLLVVLSYFITRSLAPDEEGRARAGRNGRTASITLLKHTETLPPLGTRGELKGTIGGHSCGKFTTIPAKGHQTPNYCIL